MLIAHCCFISPLKIAISMAKRAASLAREMKSIKSDLCFMQERCTLLEEENRRLRDGVVKGIRPEEDDLVKIFTPIYVTSLYWVFNNQILKMSTF